MLNKVRQVKALRILPEKKSGIGRRCIFFMKKIRFPQKFFFRLAAKSKSSDTDQDIQLFNPRRDTLYKIRQVKESPGPFPVFYNVQHELLFQALDMNKPHKNNFSGNHCQVITLG